MEGSQTTRTEIEAPYDLIHLSKRAPSDAWEVGPTKTSITLSRALAGRHAQPRQLMPRCDFWFDLPVLDRMPIDGFGVSSIMPHRRGRAADRG
jgi:hypothetical protein